MMVIPKCAVNLNSIKNDLKLVALAQGRPMSTPTQFEIPLPKVECADNRSPKK